MTREHFLIDWYEDSEAKQIGWALDFFVSLLIATVLFIKIKDKK